jgi:hypothetical protein
MSIEFCACEDCIIAAIEKIESLTAYALELESAFRVAERLLADGEGAASARVKERDLAREVSAEHIRRNMRAAAALRAAHRLH